MGAGMYRVRVVGELDSSRIRAELARLSKTPFIVGGGKGSGMGALGADAGKATKQVKRLNGAIGETGKNIKKVGAPRSAGVYANIGKGAEQSTRKMKAFGAETLNVTKKVIQFGAVTAVIRGVTSGLGDMVQNVFELDAALTEYKKVSDLTGKSLQKYTDQAYKAGRETARTGTEMIEAATQFKKMGYTDQQSMQLATTATMFQNIADAEISAGDAALFINSQLKGFSSQFDQFNSKGEASMHVIDSVNEVANNFAVGTNDLQLALSKTSSAMGGFGNSFEQTIGIITAGTEIMVGQPSKVARGWRTIGANITKLAKETDVYRDASGKVEIQMRKSDGTMKNTYEFLTDLHKSWGDLNKEQQTAIALQMGGKNQMEVFMATMNNFDTAIEATNTAMGAQGSAAKENSKYLESMAGHLANLKSAWEEFSYKMINSDLLKKGMDVLADTLHFLASDTGQAIIKLSLLATGLNLVAKAALGLKGLSLVKLFGSFTGIGKGAKGATDALKVMQRAQVGVSKGTSALYGVFGKLTGSLLGSAGLVAGIGLLSVALAKYVDIGSEVKSNKIDKEFEKTSKEVDDLNSQLEKNRNEWNKLREKQRGGEELTEAEQARLRELEAQTAELKRQLEIKKAILAQEAQDKWATTSSGQLKGAAKEKYTQARSWGQTEQQALAGVGVTAKSNRLDVAMVNYTEAANEATKAENDYRKAIKETDKAKKKYGKNSDEYFKAAKKESAAYDKQVKAQKQSSKYLKQLTKQREQMYEDFGGKEMFDKNAPETLKKSRDQLDRLIKASSQIEQLALGTGDVTQAFQDLNKAAKDSGDNFLKMSKDGKHVERINLDKLQSSMSAVGVSAEETLEYLKEFGKSHPEATIKLNGEDVAIKDLKVIDGQIRKVDKTKANPRVDVDIDKAAKKTTSFSEKVKSLTGKSITVQANTLGLQALKNLKNAINNIKSKTVNIVANIFKPKQAHGVRHFAAGGSIPNAEVNEQGFEIIQDSATGMMRVANGGKRGLTTLGKGDTVYTHGQSIRMLHKAGMSEGGVVYGHQNEDFGLFGVRKLNGFAKGKTSPLTQKQYNTKFNAITSAYDKALESLEYKKEKEHWLDTTYAKYYKQLYDKYTKQITALNKKKKAKGVKTRKTLGTDRVRAYGLAMSEIANETAKTNISNYIEGHQMTGSELTSVLKTINTARTNKKLSATEAAEYRKEAYKKNLEYNLKQYQNDKKTYKDTLALLKKYYKAGQVTADEYYKYLEDLSKEQLEKEKNRLSEQQTKLTNTYDLARAYVQRQIDLLQEENEEQEEQNQLIELQNNLAKARSQRIRIYKEGEGFVYEQDTEAIREATQALQEYQNNNKSVTNPVLKQWQEVLKLFDEIEADNAIKQLENAVGSTVGKLFGSFGTDTNAWADWIKNNLATTGGIQNVLDSLDKLVDTNDIINYLDGNGQVKDAVLKAAIANNILPETYAATITQAAQSMSVAANTSASIATQGAIASMTGGSIVSGSVTQNGNIYNFDSLVLPNVTNASEFIDALNNLDTTALQVSTQRT